MADASSNDYSYVITERDFMSLLIDLYRNKPELWKVKHKDYQDKLKRSQALKEIVKELNVYKADFTEERLKKKINIMRTNFNKERHKLEARRVEDEDAKSKLWYYNEMLFLTDQDNDIRSKRTSRQISRNQDVTESADQSEDEQKFEIRPEAPTSRSKARKPMKNVVITKRKAETDQEGSDSEVEQYMTITTTYYKKKKTKEDILAKSWAQKLTELSAEQRLFAEKIINDVLIEGEMGNLSRNGVSFCPSF